MPTFGVTLGTGSSYFPRQINVSASMHVRKVTTYCGKLEATEHRTGHVNGHPHNCI